MSRVRRRRWRRRLGFVAVCALAAACHDGPTSVVCADYAAPSIQVLVRDAATGAYLGAGSTFVQRSGSYADSASLPIDLDLPYDLSLVVESAFERSGTYDVTVRRAGYVTWERSAVHVASGVCHVETVRLEAHLQASP
jgi:hypothetical protein